MVGLNLKEIKPLTEVDYIPDEEFNSTTNLVTETPYSDEFLSYALRLPKDWSDNEEPPQKLVEKSLSQQVLGSVAKYRSPPRQYLRSFFSVDVMELTYEIGARNWFINYVLSNGMTLEQVGTESKDQVEAIYIEVKGDITYVVRIKAIKNGPRMVFARYYLPQELYSEERVQQGQVVRSFELTNRQPIGVEQLKLHGFLDQAFFNFPSSWILNAPMVRSIGRMRAMVFHSRVQGKLDGQINLYLTNKTDAKSRSEALKLYTDKFTIENYELGKFIEDTPMQYHKDMSFGATQVYAMNSEVINMIDYELWVSVMESEDYFYVISLLTPARTEEYYTWARNEAAYRIVIKNIRQEDDTVDYYQFLQ